MGNKKMMTEAEWMPLLKNFLKIKDKNEQRDFLRAVQREDHGWSDDELVAHGLLSENTSSETKLELIELAKAGKPRPIAYSKDISECKLGRRLYNYISKQNNSFDPEFTKLITNLRPDWFVNNADITKRELLKLAKSGKPKPDQHSKDNTKERKLGQSLSGYIRKSSRMFDAMFTKQITTLRPDWFIDTVELNKKELLKLAKSGKPRPNKHSRDTKERKLGCFLIGRTGALNRSFDTRFNREIRTLRPDWFINTADLTKKELLKLAKSGKLKPKQGSKDIKEHKLGYSLSHYISKSSKSFDSEFTKQITKLRPDWFERKRAK